MFDRPVQQLRRPLMISVKSKSWLKLRQIPPLLAWKRMSRTIDEVSAFVIGSAASHVCSDTNNVHAAAARMHNRYTLLVQAPQTQIQAATAFGALRGLET